MSNSTLIIKSISPVGMERYSTDILPTYATSDKGFCSQLEVKLTYLSHSLESGYGILDVGAERRRNFYKNVNAAMGVN